MIMHTLEDADMRLLMNLIFKRDVFDDFGMRQVTLINFARFDMECLPPDENGNAAAREWALFRDHAASLIKAGGKPSYMKLVMSCPKSLMTDFPGAQAMFVNVIFEKDAAKISTGYAPRGFSFGGTGEGITSQSEGRLWDEHVIRFLGNHKINIQTNEE